MAQPRPVLKEMPDHIKRSIVGSLDPWTRRTVRECSKEYLSLSDQLPLHYFQLFIHFQKEGLEVKLFPENNPTKYLALWFEEIDEENCRISNRNENWQKEEGVHYFTAAAGHICDILANPRMSLEMLKFDMDGFGIVGIGEYRHARISFLDYLGHLLGLEEKKIPVKHFCLRQESQPEDVPAILTHMEPGTLSKIELIGSAYLVDKRFDMSEIVVLEPFKRAKSLISTNVDLMCSYSDVENYDEVMKIKIPKLTLEIVKKVLENFQTQPTKRTVMLAFKKIDANDIDEYLAQFELENGQNRLANILPTSPEEYLTIILYKDRKRKEFVMMRNTRE